MNLGILMSLYNQRYFRDRLSMLCEFIPQVCGGSTHASHAVDPMHAKITFDAVLSCQLGLRFPPCR
jgi:hypothetical protein